MKNHFPSVAAHATPPGLNTVSGATMAPAPRVLIVDDEQAIRALLTRWIKGWGYGVRDAGSADQALQIMALEPADMILCDVVMPEHDGLSLAARVHAWWPRTAIIMSTACDDADTIHASRKAGASAYVIKPFDPVMLREALDQAGRERASGSGALMH